MSMDISPVEEQWKQHDFHELSKVLDTTIGSFDDIFDAENCDNDKSPLDLFNEHFLELLKIKNSSESSSPLKNNLILLGYVSAAEYYTRMIIRRLIMSDSYIFSLATKKDVSFAAAYFHDVSLLPDSIVENYSFANSKKIFESLKEIVGMPNKPPVELARWADRFNKVCELRHCCVHRFGRLGVGNALRMNLLPTDISESCTYEYLNKPITLSDERLEDVGIIVQSFVKSLNNCIYKFILKRTVEDMVNPVCAYKESWHWDFEYDRDRFSKYYDIFKSKVRYHESMSIEVAYEKFRIEFKPKDVLNDKKIVKGRPIKKKRRK